MRGKKGGRRRLGEEGGGGRRREEEGKRGKEESQHLQPITLQHAHPAPSPSHPGRTLSHRRRWMRGGAERLRCRRVIGTLRGTVLTHYIPFSIANWGCLGPSNPGDARYARGGRPVGDTLKCRGFDVPLHAPNGSAEYTGALVETTCDLCGEAGLARGVELHRAVQHWRGRASPAAARATGVLIPRRRASEARGGDWWLRVCQKVLNFTPQ